MNSLSFAGEGDYNLININIKMKRLISFDLDWTLAESKSKVDSEMINLLMKLLSRWNVAIISGWDYPQFEKQLIPYITDESLLNNLYLYPTCWTKSYIYSDWKFRKVYSEDLSEEIISKSISTINLAIEKLGLIPEKTYWELIENRWTQVTYSALWQEAPYEVKKSWDPDFSKRTEIKKLIEKDLPELSISMWGSTSIDITKKWIDKAHAISKLKKELNITEKDILFIWDALMEWWNDFAVIKTWVECIETSWPKETKKIIKKLLSK